MESVRCGVIGLGRLGTRHAENLAAAVPHAQLVAVSDSQPGVLGAFTAAHPTVKGYLDYHTLLADDDVDAVVIASSTHMHATMATEAIEAGKAIFCEKPISIDLDKTIEVQQLLRAKPTLFQLGFMRRFDPAYLNAKGQIEAGTVGRAISLRSISRDPGAPPIEFAKASGGLVVDLSIHDIDLARWFAHSEVSEVYAKGSSIRYPELAQIGDIDHVGAILTFENGFVASLEGSRNSQYGYDVRTEVVCTDGALFIGELERPHLSTWTREGLGRSTIQGFLERFEDAYLGEMNAFVQAIRTGLQPAVTVDDGVQAQLVATAINRSMRCGAPIRMSDILEEGW
ncbi:MAG: Gfo/Idh/MocA family oxidoreductase [Sphaerochaeta sp.]|nr:Gfo/Idh/MocA family oxidoreductase [Sphaerochaeta sp.]